MAARIWPWRVAETNAFPCVVSGPAGNPPALSLHFCPDPREMSAKAARALCRKMVAEHNAYLGRG